MPKVNIYLNDQLAAAVKEAKLPVSSICQKALRSSLRELNLAAGLEEGRDALTGTWNFRHFEQQLELEAKRSEKFGRSFGVGVIDIDNFKQLNDEHGHEVGDEVLIEVASRIQAEIRDIDSFARYGGEEFALLVPESSRRELKELGDRICNAISSDPFEGLTVTISLGMHAIEKPRGERSKSLISEADRAMYLAKAGGRNQAVMLPERGAARKKGA
ncbi:MAG: GGDEF domain-containing protein [Actinobacteria bacterium]|nr:GGDEF domain-containing protein [Actinomycetota bacterium]